MKQNKSCNFCNSSISWKKSICSSFVNLFTQTVHFLQSFSEGQVISLSWVVSWFTSWFSNLDFCLVTVTAAKQKVEQEQLQSNIFFHCQRERHIMDWDGARIIMTRDDEWWIKKETRQLTGMRGLLGFHAPEILFWTHWIETCLLWLESSAKNV